MDYQQSLNFMTELAKFGINPGLSRIRELLERLGNPQARIPQYLHIGGTNGKGSVAAIAECILRNAGSRTGLFTSPHLHSHRERYRINGEPISHDDFAQAMTVIAPEITAMVAAGHESPTEFELATACALWYFQRSQVETAVIEVGMGGAIDSTNVIDAKISVITNIALDHLDYLGHTEAEIAAVKAGIIKEKAVVFSGASNEALPPIIKECRKKEAQLFILGQDIGCEDIRSGKEGSTFNLYTPYRYYQDLHLPLLGRHQVGNAALAVAAAEAAGATEEAVRRGMEQASWPARLEVIGHSPEILLDGAHNPHGLAALATALKEFWPEKKKNCLIAMLDDKERTEALSYLTPILDKAVVTRSPYSSRSVKWQLPAKIFAAAGIPCTSIEDNTAALQQALAQTAKDELLVICGSLYLIADIRSMLLNIPKD